MTKSIPVERISYSLTSHKAGVFVFDGKRNPDFARVFIGDKISGVVLEGMPDDLIDVLEEAADLLLVRQSEKSVGSL